MLSTLQNTSTIKLPELTHPLSVQLDPETIATFRWRRAAFTCDSIKQLTELQSEAQERFKRRLNAVANKQKEAIEESLASKKSRSKNASADVRYFQKLRDGLEQLGEDLAKVREEATEKGEDAAIVERIFSQVGFIDNAIQSFSEPIKTPEELEKELDEERLVNQQMMEEAADLAAALLDFSCTTFCINAGDQIPATAENLKQVFGHQFMKQVFDMIVEDTTRPLVRAGSTGAL